MEAYRNFEWVYYFSVRTLRFTNKTTESNLCGDTVLTRRGAHLSKENMYTKILL